MTTTYFKNNDILPVFPLPNTILFPEVSIPLHLFESRYRQMAKDSLDRKGVICLATISEKWAGVNEGDFEFYPLGTICRIAKYDTLEDGRFNIILKGLARCEMLDCQYRNDKLYRSVRIQTKEKDLSEILETSTENELRQIAANFFKSQPTASTETEIKEHFSKMEIFQIINILCMNAAISIAEKHILFEKSTMPEMCDALFGYYASFRA